MWFRVVECSPDIVEQGSQFEPIRHRRLGPRETETAELYGTLPDCVHVTEPVRCGRFYDDARDILTASGSVRS